MPVRVIITRGTDADCKQAEALIENIDTDYLIADRGYDSDAIVQFVQKQGAIPVIPPRKNRTDQRDYDHHLYKVRSLVENAFLKLKQWRGIATRYSKNKPSFLAGVHIRCLILWCL